MYEAQQAYLYGLAENLAIASVTSTPAGIMGMDHRIGYIRKGKSEFASRVECQPLTSCLGHIGWDAGK